ncbi:hypothetical protein hbim_05948 [Mycolicibacterium mageritense]|uniref:HTH araC/xylS-type domain-containing protein n=2 Tax=Mycolicibacterium mageritense TaxID=53462 RepID=A0AAI8XRE9_MYCME|nr:hypothetical protein hbim_05948 [Mycolicibacterium mageritense]
MPAPASGRRLGPVWETTLAPRAGMTTGLTMAGFRNHSMTAVDLPVVPHPAITLIVEFGDDSLVVGDGGDLRHRGSLVAGLGLRRINMWGKGVECVEVRLSPLVAHSVLGISPAELADGMVAVDDLWGHDASRLRDQLAHTSSWQDRFALTGTLLARRRDAEPKVDPEVAWAWGEITGSHGRRRVEELADEIGWSRKRLWARFRSQIGVPPKRAASLVRFDRAVHRLAAGRNPAEVAADGGYADQSHLHREALAFTGLTPAALARHPELVEDGPGFAC